MVEQGALARLERFDCLVARRLETVTGELQDERIFGGAF